MRILIAEDEQDLCRLIVQTLTRAGYSVDACRTENRRWTACAVRLTTAYCSM